MLAVVTLHEKFTVRQAIGSALMLGGSFITQSNAGKRNKKALAPFAAATPTPTVPCQKELAAPPLKPKPTFQPRVFSGYIFGLAATMCYGSSPLMARQALLHAPVASTRPWAALHAAPTLLFPLILVKPGTWGGIKCMKRETCRGSSPRPCWSPSPRPSSTPRLRSAADGGDADLQLSLVFRLFLPS